MSGAIASIPRAAVDHDALARAVFSVALGRFASDVEVGYWSRELARSYDDALTHILDSDEAKARARDRLKLFVPPGHFYSPIVDPSDRASIRASDDPSIGKEALPGIRIDDAALIGFWRQAAELIRDCPFGARPQDGFRYHFENEMFGYGDGLALYVMLRRHRPKRIVEIGSGYSSACILDTVERFFPAMPAITCIDPDTRALRALLREGDEDRIRVIGEPVQRIDLTLFDHLEADDVLFVDSTHVSKSGSDVNREIFDILPRLAPGVLVHVHDIFYPFEYPSHWIFSENRSWNEAFLLRAFLMYNDMFEVLVFNDYAQRFHRASLEELAPLALRNPGGSIWLRRTNGRGGSSRGDA